MEDRYRVVVSVMGGVFITCLAFGLAYAFKTLALCACLNN